MQISKTLAWCVTTAVFVQYHLDEAQQGPASISDAPLPVFAARSSCQTFKLSGSEPLLVVSDAATFTS